MSDPIHQQISELVAQEHQLRERRQAGDISSEEEHGRVQELETSLDQCWDLLRQRDALRRTGQDPDGAHVRPAGTVEGYLG